MRRANAGNDEAMRRLGRYYFRVIPACNEMKSESRETYKKVLTDIEIQRGTR